MTWSVGGGKTILDVRHAGVQPAMVIAGTGTAAIEQWPVGVRNETVVDFSTGTPLVTHAPYTGFDLRTSTPFDQLAVGSVVSGAYRGSLVGSGHCHHSRLINRPFDGGQLDMEVTMGTPAMNLAVPSCLYLACATDFSKFIALEYGANSLRLSPYLSGAIQTAHQYTMSFPTALVPGDRLKVSWFLDRFDFYVNGVHRGSYTNPYYRTNFRGASAAASLYPGFGVYSSSGAYSTPIPKIVVSGSTSKPVHAIASGFLNQVAVGATSSWEQVYSMAMVKGGVQATVSLNNAGWTTSTSLSTRQFRVLVGSTVIGTITDQNGGTLTVPNVTLPSSSSYTINVEATSSSPIADNRVVRKNAELRVTQNI